MRWFGGWQWTHTQANIFLAGWHKINWNPCIMEICKQIIVLIFYKVTSRPVTLLKFIYASAEISDIFSLTLVSSSLIFLPGISIAFTIAEISAIFMP
jgi:hypothetical protein